MPNIQITQQPPTIVRVTNQQAPKVETTYLNPASFRVQDATDVALSNPSDGQLLTWNAAIHKFTVTTEVNVNTAAQAFLIANQANNTANLAAIQVQQSANTLLLKGNVFQTTYITSNGLTINTKTSLTTFGNATVIFSANAASVGGAGLVQLNDTLSSTSTTQAATANVAAALNTYSQAVNTFVSTAYSQANAAALVANTANLTANQANVTANSALNLVQSVFGLANSTTNLTTSAFAEANGFQSVINSAFTTTNSALNLAISAFNRANIGSPGGSQTILTSNGITVNSRTSLTVSGNNTITLSANLGNTTQVGIVQLNDTVTSTSTTLAATANSVNTSWATANASFIQANNALNLAQSSFTEANGFQSVINSSFSLANSTTNLVASAFAKANAAYPSTGGTVSGSITATGLIKAPFMVTNTALANTQWQVQGSYWGWNLPSGSGSTDFINSKGGGAGGFNFYNTGSSIDAIANLIVSFSSTGSITAPSIILNGVDIGSGLASVYTLANSTTNLVTGAYILANSDANLATSAYGRANEAFIQANTLFASANTNIFNRSSPATFFDNTATLQLAGNNIIRIDTNPVTLLSNGILLEASSTNFVRNSRGEGSPNTLPTFWIAGNCNLVGRGIENGIPYADIVFSGLSAIGGGTCIFDSTIPTIPGQFWTNSFYTKLISGSLTNVTTFNVATRFNNVANAFISQTLVNFTTTANSLSSQRVVNPGSVAPALANTVLPAFRYNTSGAYNFGIRFGGIQLENGNIATSLMLATANTPNISTRAADTTNNTGYLQMVVAGIDIGSGLTSVYALANSTTDLVTSAFTKANSDGTLAQAAFDKANTGGGTGSGSQTILTANGITVNTGTSLTVTGNNTIVLSANLGNTTQVGIVQLNDTFISTSATQASTANVANAIWTNHQATFLAVNSATNLVTGAYALANSAANLVASAFAEANGFQSVINSAFAVANSAGNLSTSAYGRANAAVQNQFIVTATGGVAVGGGSTQTSVGNTTIALTANAATTTVVGVVQLNDTFTSTSTTQAITANVANAIWTNHQATFLAVNSAINLVASAFTEANGFQSIINSAFTLANSTTDLVASAFTKANSDGTLAQAAFDKANTGGGTGGGSQTILTANGITVNTGTSLTVSGNNTIVLSANLGNTTQAGIVQLNDTFTSTSVSQAATANVANTIWNTTLAAFTVANAAVMRIGDTMTGPLTISTGGPGLTTNSMSMGGGTGAKINLFSTTYGIGINSSEWTLWMPVAGAAATTFAVRTGGITGTYLLRVPAMTSPGLGQGLTYSGNASSNLSGGLDRTAIGSVSPNTGIFTNIISTNNISITANVFASNVFANTALVINNIDIGSGLQSAYNLANSTTDLVTGAYSLANSDANLVASAFAEANGFQSIINSAFSVANTSNLLTSMYNPANGVINFHGVANTRGIGSRMVYANGSFANIGDAQFSSTLLRIQTTGSANTYNLSTTGANSTANIYGSINQLQLGNNTLYAFTAFVGARDANNNAKIWRTEGGIKNTVGPINTIPLSNTVIIGTPVINIIAGDNGTNNWSIALATDIANNALLFRATGSQNVTNWVAQVDVVEIA